MYSTPIPLQARGAVLQVVVIGRISTDMQNEENIAASYRYVEQHLAQMYDGPMEIEHLGERASGMLADRATIRLAEQRIAAHTVDVVIAEDLSRIFRNPRHQYVFVQNCVDAGVRLICLADHLDTADPNWEVMLATAAIRHGMFVPDTRRRVRRTATHSFHNGGMVLRVRYGYRKLSKEDAASGRFGPPGLRIAKLSKCTPTIFEMCDWVKAGVSYVRIAERLNAARIEPGHYVLQHRWSRGQVINLLRDPILSGTRRFRVVMHEPVYGTGRHRRRKCPEPEIKVYSELAHLTVDEQQEVWRIMDARTEAWRRSTERISKRRKVPRCRALWPGQAVTCGICGGLMYDMGNFLKCRNALPAATDRCWNHVHVPNAVIRQKTVEWLCAQALSVPRLQAVLEDIVLRERERSKLVANSELVELDRTITGLESRQRNLTEAIALGGEFDILLQELAAVQKQLQQSRRERNKECGSARDTDNAGPEASKNLTTTILVLLSKSYEIGDEFRALFSDIRILPVQALDTPLVRPRGKLTVQFQDRDCPDASVDLAQSFSGTIDCFEPPVHIEWRTQCVEIRAVNPKRSLKKIAADLGIGYMTVKRALNYDSLMRNAGIPTPYRELVAPPAKASRWIARRPTRATYHERDSAVPDS